MLMTWETRQLIEENGHRAETAPGRHCINYPAPPAEIFDVTSGGCRAHRFGAREARWEKSRAQARRIN
ncbi:hypothetical protein RRG08_043118 [Elysia crispata]|uniref:Uncharacterized protein n=1 Tax=Elysia crispata TaxID=231223 RepID=A0AAE0XZ68_9GAST|nr:hypothetical protein RRG08_043118 [Elysia crispata]